MKSQKFDLFGLRFFPVWSETFDASKNWKVHFMYNIYMHQFLGVHVPNKILSNLISEYEISSYIDTASIAYHLLIKKEIVELFDLSISILFQSVLVEVLKF